LRGAHYRQRRLGFKRELRGKLLKGQAFSSRLRILRPKA
jgi:hypothetical protein